MKVPSTVARVLASAALLALPLSSHAIFRAYISSTGSDTNPCTLQQPCRLLPRALEVVDNGGQVWMLDSANYNTSTVTITKSVTIQAIPGAVGSVVANNADAIVISQPFVSVALRNLDFVKLGSGRGIVITGSNSRIHVEKCSITGLQGRGIHMASNLGTLAVVDTVFRANQGEGILATRGTVRVSRSHFFEHDIAGILLKPDSTSAVVGHVHDSVAMGNFIGFAVETTAAGQKARLHASRSVASNNETGFFVRDFDGPATQDATLLVSASVANDNFEGFLNDNGTLISAGNNTAMGNILGAAVGGITPADQL